MKINTKAKPSRRDRWLRVVVVLAILALLMGLVLMYAQHTGRLDPLFYNRSYESIVAKYALAYGIPENLVYAVIRTESHFDADAVSPRGASGLMQLMPTTFRWLSDDMLGEKLADDRIFDPETNIRYGCYYLRRLYDRYGSWVSACAAYNAGQRNVDEWLEDDSLTDKEGHLIFDRIPFEETRNYIRRISNAYEAYEGQHPSPDSVPFE